MSSVSLRRGCKIICSYICYNTATGVGIEIRTSPDRTAWTLAGLVWPNGASWTDPYTGTTNGYELTSYT